MFCSDRPGLRVAHHSYTFHLRASLWSHANRPLYQLCFYIRHVNRLSYLAEEVPPFPGGFTGRGIVVVGGGDYLEPVLVLVALLRAQGCQLPIEVWHVGPEEMPPESTDRLRQVGGSGVTPVDFHSMVPASSLEPVMSNVGPRRFQLKPLALAHTRFEQVLMLDADNAPVRDPTYLFDDLDFVKTGVLFWPDFWMTTPDNPIWDALGIPMHATARGDWELETGQLLLHKSPLTWRALQLTVYLNREEYMHRLLNGDKDTFRLAWLATQTPFTMVPTRPLIVGCGDKTCAELDPKFEQRATLDDQRREHEDWVYDPFGVHCSNCSSIHFCGHTMLQHDMRGHPIFVHHNQLKRLLFPPGKNFPHVLRPANPGVRTRLAGMAPLIAKNGKQVACSSQLPEPPADPRGVIVEHSKLQQVENAIIAAQEHVAALINKV